MAARIELMTDRELAFEALRIAKDTNERAMHFDHSEGRIVAEIAKFRAETNAKFERLTGDVRALRREQRGSKADLSDLRDEVEDSKVRDLREERDAARKMVAALEKKAAADAKSVAKAQSGWRAWFVKTVVATVLAASAGAAFAHWFGK